MLVETTQVKAINFPECLDIQHAVETVASHVKSEDERYILYLTIYIERKFEFLSKEELKIFAGQCGSKNLVIFFASKNHDMYWLVWKSKEMDFFLQIAHFREKYKISDENLYEFVADFLAKALGRGDIGEFSWIWWIYLLLADLNL